MMDDQSESFIPPPEAPVFTPTAAEFTDPIAYISKIRPTIEKTGICKIKPPQDWQPPFVVDVENFKFVPRVQKINELEATTRVKLIFLNKLFKFWDLQGVVLKVPTVNRKPLDFHKLHKIVQEEGGYEQVTADGKWKHVAVDRMNLPTNANKSYSMVIKSHYEKFLHPYDVFESGVSYNHQLHSDVKMKGAVGKSPKKEGDVNYSMNSEMKKLQYFGAGRKVALPSIKHEDGEDNNDVIGASGQGLSAVPRRAMRDRSKASYLESDICRLCSLTDNEEDMLTCSNCDEVYHRYCLIPRVSGLIRGDWRCPRCVAKEYKKPTEVFGFEQSNKQYSLASFGMMADKFKETYFNKAVENVSCAEVEREFWRLTKSINEDVTVQYGADIHALTNGSGFPTEPSEDLTEEDEKYIHSKWNLNNLPVNEQSVLKYVSGDVSGMKVPWCYVGMCFSSFCWHIEDHWSYSINFHHWGEPKTWYGVPSSHAEDLEEVMKSRAPELFEQSPDLLHHITTIMNPNSLMSHNIPVVRTNQCAGEFIVTAPRAFHAGFNQGYNFAEAVNFCPADWLPMGRASINNYKQVKRHCVFSHEELVCKMAADADSLDLTIAVEAHKELLAIVDQERKLRKKLLEHGVKKAEREAFELLPDDERQCSYCKTTCFLSAITCPCKPNKSACIEHVLQLCHCPGSRKCLRYRYTLDELPAMIRNLGRRVEGYQLWTHNTRAVFNTTELKDRVSFNELKQLLIEARENGYPDNILFKNLQRAVKDSEKYVCLVKEVVNRKARSRRHTDLAIRSAARRLTVEELGKLVSQLSALACSIKDSDMLEDLLSKGTQFQTDVRAALCVEPLEREKLAKLYEVGVSLDLDMVEMADLEQAVEQTKWVEDVRENLEVDIDDDDLVTVDELKILVSRGHSLPVHPDVDKLLTELEHLLKVSQSWEEKASICLQATPRHTLSTIEAILSECDGIKVYLPNIESLRESVERSLEWKAKVEQALNSTPHPTLDHLRSLVTKAKALPIKLDLVENINSMIKKSEEWKSEAYSHFVKVNSAASLLDVLLPRYSTKPPTPRKRQQLKKSSRHQQQLKENQSRAVTADKLIDTRFSTEDMYEKSALYELESMKELRLSNQSGNASKLCRCGLNPTGSMFQCELCREWLHYTCSGLSTESHTDSKSSCDSQEKRFLCSRCVRSKRPKLDVILMLLVSLQKIAVRFVEGEALQYLTERTITWQEMAETFIGGQQFTQLNKKFDAIRAKNAYWKGREEEQADFEMLTAKDVLPPDHDYISPYRPTHVHKLDHPVFDICDIEPSDEFCSHLNSLLMEGQLLEVSVHQSTQMHKFSKTLCEYKLNKLQPPPPPLPTKHPRKSVLSSRDVNIKRASKCGLTGKPTQEAIISSTTSNHRKNTTRVSRKRSDRQAETGNKRKRERKTIVIEITEEDEWGEYDEQCAAIDGCLLPDGESIGWVQCEACKLWFHFACIGVSPNQLANGDYFCVACQPHSEGEGYMTSGVEEDSQSIESLVCRSTEEQSVQQNFLYSPVSPSSITSMASNPVNSKTSNTSHDNNILVFPPLSSDSYTEVSVS